LTFDFIKGQKPVGNAVRDAACYILYSLVRTTPPALLEPFIPAIAVRLVCVATLDPSTTIRRAASAAFQELVGRQSFGVDRVPQGINVLSMMDYHAVGARRGAFEVASQVAAVDGRYREGLVEWCVVRGVGHWEEKGREGAAKVLGKMFLDDRKGIELVLQQLVTKSRMVLIKIAYLPQLDVFRIHGSLLAIGELILTLSEDEISTHEDLYKVYPTLRHSVQDVQYCLQKLPDYAKKSVHASLITNASLQFIKCISSSQLPIADTTLELYIQLIELSFHKSSELIQQTASEALGELSIRQDISSHLSIWFRNLQGKSSFIVHRGWALTFGYIHLSQYDDVLSVLYDSIEREMDIEAKRNAIKSVGLIFSRAQVVKCPSLFD